MLKNFQTLFAVLLSSLVLTACGPGESDAKKLGFSSVEEMKDLQSKGFENKDSYLKAEKEKAELELYRFPVKISGSGIQIADIRGQKFSCKSASGYEYRLYPIGLHKVCASNPASYIKDKDYLKIKDKQPNWITFEKTGLCEAEYGMAIAYLGPNGKIVPILSFLNLNKNYRKEFEGSYWFELDKSLTQKYGVEKDLGKSFFREQMGDGRAHSEVTLTNILRLDRASGVLQFALATSLFVKENEWVPLSKAIRINFPEAQDQYQCEALENSDEKNKATVLQMVDTINSLESAEEKSKAEGSSKNKF